MVNAKKLDSATHLLRVMGVNLMNSMEKFGKKFVLQRASMRFISLLASFL